MKAYTDLSQSKKLAEILPLESADMCFNTRNNMPPLMTPYSKFNEFFNMEKTPDFLIPCWSLVALLDVIPKCIGDYNIFRMDINDIDTSMWYDKIGYGVCNELPDITIKEPVDACVAMIEKLHKQKLL